jgi:predicted metalloprotease with PDZ domain
VVRALDAVQPYDWTTFLRQRLDSTGNPAPLDGLRRGGYQLIYTETQSALQDTHEQQQGQLTLLFSIGIEIDNKKKAGSISSVIWDSPAFKAKLIEGEQIIAVDGIAYSAQVLKDAIRAAKTTDHPIELIVKSGDRFTLARLDYHEGLRYPHLERETSEAARLDEILAPR